MRQLREKLGITQAVLAGRIGRSEHWVVDLESGKVDPRLGQLRALASALGVSVVALLSQSDARDGPAAVSLEPEDQETKRREFLAAMLAVTAGSIDVERLTAPGVDAGWTRDAEIVSAMIASQRNRVAPGTLVASVLGQLRELEARLPVTTELTAETALLAGSVLIKDGQLGPAYRCYSLAEALGDTVVRGKAITGRAAVHARRAAGNESSDQPRTVHASHRYQGDLRRSLELQDLAVATMRGTAPRAQAGVLVVRAVMHAKAGHDTAAMRDLEAADRAITLDDYRWYYLSPEHQHEVGAYAGEVLMLLGRHREAVDTLDRTLLAMDPTALSWRARVAADRDAALAQLS